jgi:hypothetical protein
MTPECDNTHQAWRRIDDPGLGINQMLRDRLGKFGVPEY